MVLESALGRLCVKSSFLGRSAGVRWCLLEVSSHFSNHNLKVCRWGLGISLPLTHSATQSFSKLQCYQKYVQVSWVQSQQYWCFHDVVLSSHWIQGETTWDKGKQGAGASPLQLPRISEAFYLLKYQHFLLGKEKTRKGLFFSCFVCFVMLEYSG